MDPSYVDYFLTGVVDTAAYAREADVRKYLAKHGNQTEQRLASSCPVGQLRNMMKRRAGLLQKDGRRLEHTFQFLFGFSVWPEDERSAQLVRDLARLRNLIIHMGGYPTEIHFKEMETQGFIQETSAQLKFYKLDLATAAPLVLEGVKAAGTLVRRLGDHFQADERWHHPQWFEQLPSSVSEAEL